MSVFRFPARGVSAASILLASLLTGAGWRVAAADAVAFDPTAGLPLVQNYLPDVYQAHAQIFASVQAPDGVLYFGTFGNVLSFDGERWRKFPVSGAWIRALAVGPDGLIYVGGNGLLGRLEPAPDSGLLRFVSLTAGIPVDYASFATVWSAASHAGSVYFAIDDAVLEWKENAFHVTPFPGQRPALRPAGDRLFCHVGDTLLVRRDQAWTPHVQDARLKAVRRLTIIADGDGGLIIGADNGTVFRLAASGATLAEWPALTQLLRPAGLRNGLRLPDGRLVLSTGGEGVWVLAPEGTPLLRLTVETGLAQTSTYGLTLARDGTLWIETANGLSHFDPHTSWTMFDQRNGRPAGIGGEPISSAGEALFQFSDIGALRLRPATDGRDFARLEPIPGTPARIGNLVEFEGVILTGNERGLVRLTPSLKTIYAADGQIEDILVLPPDRLALGLIRGLEVVRVAPDLTVQPLGRVPSFDAEVTNIEPDIDGALWVGTVAGYALRVRPPASGDWSRAEITRFDAKRGLPGGAVWVKTIRAGDEMLVSTQPGVYRFNRTTDRLEPHPRFAGYAFAGINNLPGVTDNKGRFWFQIAVPGGGFQPGCLDLRGPTPQWTPLPSAIPETLGYGGSRVIAYEERNGRELLWLSGTRNTIRYDLGRPPPVPAAPTVLISEIAQGGRHWAADATPDRLEFSREPLRLQVASPAASNQRVTYESRLVGYQPTWSVAEGDAVVFTNLSGGPFRFEVRARDARGVAGPVAHYTFSVTPPWHRSAAAYSLYAFFALGGVAGFVRWRLGHARREQRRLEALVATRTTELAAARDQAERANHAKSAFLASMSHELRTPLNGVIGYAQVLQNDTRLLPDQQERLRIVRASGEHLLRMINDVLDLAKIEAGKIELRVAPFALGDLLRDIAAAHAAALAAKRLGFSLETAPDLPDWVEGDAQKLRQVLDNLLGNAVKFTARGHIALRVARAPAQADALSFAVHDTGLGIAPADREKLFRPFEQAHATRANVAGTGLGLAISRALVERMGGALEVDTAVGVGSTFSFRLALPATAVALTPSASQPNVVGFEGPARRILIVDDHPINRSLLVDLLQPLGFVCAAHASGAETLLALTRDGEAWPDLAILDVRMEGMDGLELTRKLRALAAGRPLRILLMSASVLTFNPEDGRVAGCDDFLSKPFRTADLLERIGALLALRWRAAGSRAPFAPAAPGSVIPAAAREALGELLAVGDLEAFRAALGRWRTDQPAAEARWQELDEAAAGFQLSRLRQLLEQP